MKKVGQFIHRLPTLFSKVINIADVEKRNLI